MNDFGREQGMCVRRFALGSHAVMALIRQGGSCLLLLLLCLVSVAEMSSCTANSSYRAASMWQAPQLLFHFIQPKVKLKGGKDD